MLRRHTSYRRGWAIAVAGITLAVPQVNAQQASPERMRVSVDNVNLRAAPSIDSSIVRVLAKGALVTVLARDGHWVKVQSGLGNGWVRASQLVAAPGTGGQSATALQPPSVQPGVLPAPPPSSGHQPATVHVSSSPRAVSGGGPGSTLTFFDGATRSTAAFTQAASGATYGNRSGFGGGIGFVSGGRVGAELDVMYLQKGLSLTAGGNTQTVKTAYAEGALLLRIAIGGRSTNLFLVVGPEAGYEITCDEMVRVAENTTSSSCATDAGFAGHRKLDYGVLGGVGVRFGPLTVQGRYDFGMRNLYLNGDAHGENRVTTALVGFIL
ncbi:MAG: outer membrane beta-barrel protein [Gemmatimonadales bacterium]